MVQLSKINHKLHLNMSITFELHKIMEKKWKQSHRNTQIYIVYWNKSAVDSKWVNNNTPCKQLVALSNVKTSINNFVCNKWEMFLIYQLYNHIMSSTFLSSVNSNRPNLLLYHHQNSWGVAVSCTPGESWLECCLVSVDIQ